MARDDLVSGNVWEQYSRKVQERMNSPKAMGEFSQEDADKAKARLVVADFGAESCGDAVRLFWLVNEENDQILDSKFKSFGCGTAIASSDAMAELCIGKSVDDAIKITNTEVEAFLRDDDGTPAVPPQKMHCSVMAYDVILEAAAQYKGVERETLQNADIVCECARVTHKELIDSIKVNNITDVAEITKITKAGAYCKSCVRPGGHEEMDIYLVDVLENTRKDMNSNAIKEAAANPTKSFDKMTVLQRLKEVEAVIDEKIRPMLVMDGGDMEIIDIQENVPYYDIYISYLGNCGSCESSSTGTLYAIENVLKQKVDENIRVLPI